MTAEAFTIRAAQECDLPQLTKLIRVHATYELAAELRPDLEDALRSWLFSSHPRTRVLVAARGEALVGYASWSMEASTWQACEYAHMASYT